MSDHASETCCHVGPDRCAQCTKILIDVSTVVAIHDHARHDPKNKHALRKIIIVERVLGFVSSSLDIRCGIYRP